MRQQHQRKVRQRRSKRNLNPKNTVNIQLETKCSCSQSHDDATIQFTCRYLQCDNSMPIRILRLLIESIIPYSPTVKMSIFDANDRLLKDSDRLRSLKHTCTSSNHIPLRFTLINTVTSLAHCPCLSSPFDEMNSSTVIQQETIENILSTCSLPSAVPPEIPPSLPTEAFSRKFMIDYILSEYGEICLPKQFTQEIVADSPLDLSMKNHSLSSSTKWIQT